MLYCKPVGNRDEQPQMAVETKVDMNVLEALISHASRWGHCPHNEGLTCPKGETHHLKCQIQSVDGLARCWNMVLRGETDAQIDH